MKRAFKAVDSPGINGGENHNVFGSPIVFIN
jgi:hypothetical protein